MGVYIKGMEMPTSCGVCRFAVDGWCYAYGKPNIDALANDGRTNFCPLFPIPPHGRLIDADAFTKDECNNCDGACEALPCDCLNCKADCRCDFMQDIANAPTVIPAEEGDNG